MQAILKQLDFELEEFEVRKGAIETLFIGGGTPSTVSPELYAPFFEKIAPFLAQDAEITSEANPNSADRKWLEGMHTLGVNRISFGVQSFDPEKLRFLGRNHTQKQAVEAPHLAQEARFENISIDLIYGTAVDTESLLFRDLETAFSLPINHLSAYSLTIEEGTPFQNSPEVSNDNENLARRFTERIRQTFPQYEISNFGNYRSRHNLGYWQYKDYIGIGSGAVGFTKNRRFYPLPSIEAYIADPLQRETETLDCDAIKSEKVLLGLRSIVGIDVALLNEEEYQRAEILLHEGKLIRRNNKLYNPDYFLSDEIALFLLD